MEMVSIGYGTARRTRTHIIANWTDGARYYAHARPLRRGCPVEAFLAELYCWKAKPKYEVD